MFNLLKKDFILQKNLLIPYIAIILVYLWTEFPIIASVGFVTTLFVINSHYYDEREKVNILLNSLPYTRKEIVSSKYIEAPVVAVVVFIIAFFCKMIWDGELAVTFGQMIFSVFLTLLFAALYLPLFFKFTQQYLRIIFSIVLALLLIQSKAISDYFYENFTHFVRLVNNQPSVAVYAVFVVFVLIVYAVSWLISVRIYSKKAF